MEMRVEGDSMTQMAESHPLSLSPTETVPAVALAGGFSAAQVYFRGPEAWISPTIFVRLYGRFGGGRLLLAEVALASTKHTEEEDGQTTALAISVAGVQVEGFEVAVVRGEEAEEEGAVVNGRILLVAGTAAAGADIRPGLPAALQPLIAQGAPAALSRPWPVVLSDGAAEAGTGTNALHVRKSDRRAAYYVSTVVDTGTTPTTGRSLLYVWNNMSGKRAEIRRITIAYGGGTDGWARIRGAHITARPTSAGGDSITPLPLDPSDVDSSLSGVAGGDSTTRVELDLIAFTVPFTAVGTFVWTWTDLGKPIVLPADMKCGFEIAVDVSATEEAKEMKVHLSIEWLEI